MSTWGIDDPEGMCSGSRDFFKLWEISDIPETPIPREMYIAYDIISYVYR